MVTLENVSFRVVGPFLRINQTFSAVDTAQQTAGIPFAFHFPTLDVDEPPTVAAVMAAIKLRLFADGFTFDYSNLGTVTNNPADNDTLNRVSFGPNGGQHLVLDAHQLSQKLEAGMPEGEPCVVAAWQYYIFKKGQFNEDERVEVSGRARYTRSLQIRSNMRIIWRLLLVYRGTSLGQPLQIATS